MSFLNRVIIFSLIIISSAYCRLWAEKQKSEGSGTIKIGLLISDSKSTAARSGAELAVKEANEKGGFKGKYFRLIVRSMEGPWGTGSKEAVSMIFDEDVLAIMGSHDGRNAHLVEQVSAKSRVVFLSAWASDPTLSQAFVPWFFNCVPNDIQQSDALVKEIFVRRSFRRVAVISDSDYDSESALDNFLKKVAGGNRPEPLQFRFDEAFPGLKGLTDELTTADFDCVVLFVQPPGSLEIAGQLRMKNKSKPVFGPLFLLDENKIPSLDLKKYDDVSIVSSEDLTGSMGIRFSEDYKRTYGNMPGAVASYAFDGMNVLIEAIKKSGADRDKIKNSLKEINYEGVTGIIQFDDKGNRRGLPGFVRMKNGIPVSAER